MMIKRGRTLPPSPTLIDRHLTRVINYFNLQSLLVNTPRPLLSRGVIVSPQSLRLYITLSVIRPIRFVKHIRAPPLGVYISPVKGLLASCKYCNLPYFQSTCIHISPFQDVWMSSFPQSLSPYLIVVRYFAASIDSILILGYHISGVTLCPKHVTTLSW